jgi:hypothetical protein
MSERSISESDEEDVETVQHVVTATQMLSVGLLMFFTERRMKNTKSNLTNLVRFKKKFGVHPNTACTMYEDLQKTKVDGARIKKPNEKSLKFFLAALNMLKRYPKEDDLESTFDYSPRYISGKVWHFIKCLQLMKAEVICWPDDLGGNDIFIMTVDGTHCWIKEPSHPEFSQDRKAYSHKLNKAGLSYELGICLVGGLIWMNGPYLAGTNDITIFRKENGLKERLEKLGKRAIGDFGYRAEPKYVSFPNSHDSKSVAMFKSRASKRHENFNGMMKEFDVLAGRFRHDEEKFKEAFEATAVVCQYKLENEMPLYHVLVQAVVDADDNADDSNDDDDTDDDDDDTDDDTDDEEEDDNNNDDEDEEDVDDDDDDGSGSSDEEINSLNK